MENFNNECRIILGCMYYGFIIAFIYNFVIILRERFKRHYIFEYIFDIVVGIVLGVAIFLLVYKNNNGNMRVYYFIATSMGIGVYVKIFSKSVSGFLRSFWKK